MRRPERMLIWVLVREMFLMQGRLNEGYACVIAGSTFARNLMSRDLILRPVVSLGPESKVPFLVRVSSARHRAVFRQGLRFAVMPLAEKSPGRRPGKLDA